MTTPTSPSGPATTTPTTIAGSDAGLRPSVLQLAIRDKGALHAAYMSFVQGGGLFVPTTRAAQIGDDVFAIVSLLDDPAKLPIPGKVCWITPAGVPGRQQGIGMRFAANEAGEQARLRIEKLLSGSLASTRPTHTI
jgi:type IV pilus assembly protein PilZ